MNRADVAAARIALAVALEAAQAAASQTPAESTVPRSDPPVARLCACGCGKELNGRRRRLHASAACRKRAEVRRRLAAAVRAVGAYLTQRDLSPGELEILLRIATAAWAAAPRRAALAPGVAS